MRRQQARRVPNWGIGLIISTVLAILSVYAFTKTIPFVGDPYEVRAVFSSASNVRVTAPVRIAGVNVGEVTEVKPLTSDDSELRAAADGAPGAEQGSGQQAAVVTMEITDEGRPIKEDATFKLRPRLFLEGNLFVQLRPGTPNAPEAGEGHVFGMNQTSYAVQLDQVLTTLQSDVRKNLQTFLDQFGNALIRYGGAEGFRELYRSSGGAFRYTSQVNEALLGTRPHDLSGLVRDLDSTVRALGQNETALQDLVTNLRVFTGAFAAESASLERAISELPRLMDAARPAFANLNAAFPPLRSFARVALPGVRSTVPALDAANPFIVQLRKLMRGSELRGLVADLRPAVPELAALARGTVGLFREARAVSSCFNEVTIPWGNSTVPDPDFPSPGPLYKLTGYTLTGINGESRSGDGNGNLFRVQQGGGSNTVQLGGQVGLTDLPIEGINPPIESSLKTPFVLPDGREVGDIPCERQDPPNLDSGGPGLPPAQSSADANLATPLGRLARERMTIGVDLLKAQLLRASGGGRRGRTLERSALRRQHRFERHDQARLERLLGVGQPGRSG